MGRLKIEKNKTNRRITAVTGQKSPMVGIMKDVPDHCDNSVVKLDFLIEGESHYDVTDEDTTIEYLKGVIDLGYRVLSL